MGLNRLNKACLPLLGLGLFLSGCASLTPSRPLYSEPATVLSVEPVVLQVAHSGHPARIASLGDQGPTLVAGQHWGTLTVAGMAVFLQGVSQGGITEEEGQAIRLRTARQEELTLRQAGRLPLEPGMAVVLHREMQAEGLGIPVRVTIPD